MRVSKLTNEEIAGNICSAILQGKNPFSPIKEALDAKDQLYAEKDKLFNELNEAGVARDKEISSLRKVAEEMAEAIKDLNYDIERIEFRTKFSLGEVNIPQHHPSVPSDCRCKVHQDYVKAKQALSLWREYEAKW